MLARKSIGVCRRWLNNEVAQGEKRLAELLRKHFPAAAEISVEDSSGGCGSFFRILIVSTEFKGKSILEQHKMVNQALGDELKKLHGVNIQTITKK